MEYILNSKNFKDVVELTKNFLIENSNLSPQQIIRVNGDDIVDCHVDYWRDNVKIAIKDCIYKCSLYKSVFFLCKVAFEGPLFKDASSVFSLISKIVRLMTNEDTVLYIDDKDNLSVDSNYMFSYNNDKYIINLKTLSYGRYYADPAMGKLFLHIYKVMPHQEEKPISIVSTNETSKFEHTYKEAFEQHAKQNEPYKKGFTGLSCYFQLEAFFLADGFEKNGSLDTLKQNGFVVPDDASYIKGRDEYVYKLVGEYLICLQREIYWNSKTWSGFLYKIANFKPFDTPTET